MKLTKTEKAAVAILFASGEPVPVSRLAQVFDCDDAAAHWMMRRVMDAFDEEESPLQVLRLDTQYQMTTREEYR
ncbi:MAG: SMC-Scp complex subunit ScpB, partial [Oscillospiraceae bacterium]|nr:SMC-Scp complex subunit ScpB [Oscillospiraceae bacterium]